VIHPFREGNGRTQRIFFEHLLAHCGYGVQWSKINNKEVWIQANIDGFNCRLDGLIAILTPALSLLNNKKLREPKLPSITGFPTWLQSTD